MSQVGGRFGDEVSARLCAKYERRVAVTQRLLLILGNVDRRFPAGRYTNADLLALEDAGGDFTSRTA